MEYVIDKHLREFNVLFSTSLIFYSWWMKLDYLVLLLLISQNHHLIFYCILSYLILYLDQYLFVYRTDFTFLLLYLFSFELFILQEISIRWCSNYGNLNKNILTKVISMNLGNSIPFAKFASYKTSAV